MPTRSAKQEAVRVTLIGMYLDIALGLAKILGGVFMASFALIADGIHSLSDAVTDIFVLVVAHYAHEAPDAEHPYGHGRFEAVGTVLLGMVLFAVAGILLFDAVERLLAAESLPVPAWGTLLIAAASIAGKEWIYRFTMAVADRLNSSLLKANAWHSRTDAISSVAVLIGLTGALQGFPWLDVVAAMFVALIIAKIGYELCLDSLRELVDTAIPLDRQQQICECILGVQGIHRVNDLRSRRSGTAVLLEAQIQVDPRISVSEGHQLGETARLALIRRFNEINDVIIHVNPEAHDPAAADHLPLRDEIVGAVKQRWQEILPEDDIKSIELHYLSEGIEVELHLVRAQIEPSLARDLAQRLSDLTYISRLKVLHDILDTRLPLDL